MALSSASNARLRDELLDGEIFYTLKEVQIVIESWRRHYNAVRPHASLGYKPPAPEVFTPRCPDEDTKDLREMTASGRTSA